MSASPSLPARNAADSPWAPFAIPAFRWLWIATTISNVGTWMHDVGAQWFITTSPAASPLIVSLLSVAGTLPVALLALPAGVLADVVDRRRILLAAQLWMVATAAAMAIAAYGGMLQPWGLLGFTFLLNIGAALTGPAMMAVLPTLVGPSQIAPAAALNSLGVNLARAVGPAVGGAVIVAAGTTAVFALNALSTLAVVFAVMAWKPTAAHATLPRERLSGAFVAGLRYAWNAPLLKAALVRTFLFASTAAGFVALLPLVGRGRHGLGAGQYGMLLGVMGVGAVMGAYLLAKLRARGKGAAETVIAFAVPLYAAGALLVAWSPTALVAAVGVGLAGAGWLKLVTTHAVASQRVVPAWVRARAAALYVVAFSGGLSVGGFLWGTLASGIGTHWALTLSVLALLVSSSVGRRMLPLAEIGTTDLLPASSQALWPAPFVAGEGPAPDKGPVLISIEYRIPAENRDTFLHLMEEMRLARHREGAYSWHVFEDVAEPGLFTEQFTVASWLDHLRQHDRVNHADGDVRLAVRRLHVGTEEPVVRHHIEERTRTHKD